MNRAALLELPELEWDLFDRGLPTGSPSIPISALEWARANGGVVDGSAGSGPLRSGPDSRPQDAANDPKVRAPIPGLHGRSRGQVGRHHEWDAACKLLNNRGSCVSWCSLETLPGSILRRRRFTDPVFFAGISCYCFFPMVLVSWVGTHIAITVNHVSALELAWVYFLAALILGKS